MNWNDMMKNLGYDLENQGKRALGSITDAWDDFKNIDSLTLPILDSKILFNSVSQISSVFSDAGTSDNTQTDLLHGLTEIWTNGNTELQKIAGNENKYTVKDFETDQTVTISQEEYDRTRDDGEYSVISSPSDSADYTPVTKFQNFAANEQFTEIVDTSDADRLNFQTPDWGYADFINERAVFQKSLQNPLGDQGWFYFKIFFNFDTQYGLFGGLLNDKDPMMATNSAYKYLRACEALGKYYKTNDRQVALVKFAKILSYISTYAPWFFKGIKNLNQANIPQINDLTKEKSIEIECANDAIDMRLNTLLDLYKFACYDEIDQKEIVPDNLRKFDMTVMVFQSPLKYFHTSFRTNTGHKYDYKGAYVNNNTGFSDTMSFKMFTFINCEIDRESLGNMIPGAMTNDKPFNMGGGSIKIFYDRVYTHTMNEFMHIMFGNDGLYYDGSSSTERLQGVDEDTYRRQTELQRQRIKDIAHAYDEGVANVDTSSLEYKNIVDASESLCSNNMRALGFNALGNFAGGNKDLQFNDPRDRVKLSDYYDLKLKMLKNDSAVLNQILSSVSDTAGGMITELLEAYNNRQAKIRATWSESDKNLTTDKMGHIVSNTQRQTAGNLYWRNKINAMKDGYVSPETLVQRYELQRYDYTVFTKSGYNDKIINLDPKGKIAWNGPGTDYWQRKIAAMTDGIVSPETLEQRYENQTYEHSNKYGNYTGSGQQDKTLVTDRQGVPISGVGTNYWLEKIRQLKEGMIDVNPPEIKISNERTNSGLNDPYSRELLNEKLKDLKDGVIEKKQPTINISNLSTIEKTGDPNKDILKSKIENIKEGMIDANPPEIKITNEPTIPRTTDLYNGVYLEDKLYSLKNGTIESVSPSIEVKNERTSTGLNDLYGGEYLKNKIKEIHDGTIEDSDDPYSGEYFQEKINEMNDGIVDPSNLVSNNIKSRMYNNLNNELE